MNELELMINHDDIEAIIAGCYTITELIEDYELTDSDRAKIKAIIKKHIED